MNAAALRLVLDTLPLPAAVLRDGQVVGVNQLYCDLIGYDSERLLGEDSFFLIVADPNETVRLRQRQKARGRGEVVPDHFELTLRHANGGLLPVRVRGALFPAAGQRSVLYVLEQDPGRSRSAQLIRGFVDVAVAAQREDSEQGVFRAAREGLSALGFENAVCEVVGGRFRLLLTSHADGALGSALAQHGSGWISPEDVPGCGGWTNPQGVLVEDLPGLLANLRRASRAEFGGQAHLRLVAAPIPVDGHAAYVVAAVGAGLDSAVAGAFGLFGRQLGAALETVRRLAELARKNREQLLVNHVARTTATLGSGVALQAALDQVAHSVSASAVALFRREEEQLTLAVSRGFPFGWATSNQRVPLKAPLLWVEAANTREIVHFGLEGDVALRRPTRAPTPPHGVRRLGSDAANEPPPPDSYGVAVPLQISDRVHGLLLLSRQSPAFADAEVELLATVAAQLAVNLQNEVLFDQAQRRVSELQLLVELGQAVVSSLELPKVLAEAARVAVRMLRCSAAYVMLPDEGGQNLICAAGADPHVGGDLVGTLVPLGAPSMSADAFRTLRPAASSDPTMTDPLLVAEFGCMSTLAVPLHLGDKALGVLCLIERSERREFTPQETRLASHAANLISVALENARLYAEQRQRAEEMARLNDLSRSLVGAVELRPILDEAARTLRAMVDASACFILLYDATERALRVAVAPAEVPEQVLAVSIPIDSVSISARALRERRPLQISDARSSPQVRSELVRLLNQRSLLVVPLLAREQPVGVAVLDETRRERIFTHSEIERVTGVCGQIALAILAARLYEDLRGSYAALARTQAELVERERLAVVGELSASIAHEVRNPLGVIFNSLGSLRRLLHEPDGDVKLLLDIIGEEADRLNGIVGDLLDFARPMRPTVQPTGLRPLIEDAVAAARAQLEGEARGQVHVEVAEDLDAVPADARLLRQALVNLVLNALQALGRGGKVRVRAARGELQGKPAVRITVSDDGPGVAAPLRPRVFQPFFTTKAKGTGLGLAVVKRIVEAHGGSVSLADTPEGDGAEFRVTLPLAPPA